MAQPQGQSRPRAKTPAERAEEAAGVQRRLKQEAADRREAAAAKPAATGSTSGGRAGRRPTP
jgi:hypothetical protein